MAQPNTEVSRSDPDITPVNTGSNEPLSAPDSAPTEKPETGDSSARSNTMKENSRDGTEDNESGTIFAKDNGKSSSKVRNQNSIPISTRVYTIEPSRIHFCECGKAFNKKAKRKAHMLGQSCSVWGQRPVVEGGHPRSEI